MSALTCGIAVAALVIGLFALLAESTSIFFYTFVSSFGSDSMFSPGIGPALMWLGYFGLIAGFLVSCLGCWRGFQAGVERV